MKLPLKWGILNEKSPLLSKRGWLFKSKGNTLKKYAMQP